MSIPTYQHKNKELLNRLEKIDITEFIRRFLILHRKKEWWLPPKISSFNQAQELKDLLNQPENTEYKSMHDLQGEPYWDRQDVDFVPSNLGEGRGFVFYFVCNGCQNRVKYLYQYSYCNTPLCRSCCHIKYKAPSRKERNLSRLLNKGEPYFSSEKRYMIAKIAGITKEDIPVIG